MNETRETSAPLEVRGLSRRFGPRTALAELDLTVASGEIVGVVGPNGSGKTTLFRVLAGLLRSGAGSARVFGLDPWRAREDVMRRARVVFAPPDLYGDLTAREHLELVGGLAAAEPITSGTIDAALEEAGLAERARDLVRTFSLGMRQRLALALALLPPTDLLVLDEPTDGLDPSAVADLIQRLLALRERRGTTILLSSHHLSEIESLADRMLVLSEGRTRYLGAPEELVRACERLEIVTNKPLFGYELMRRVELDAHIDESGVVRLPHDAVTLEELRAILGEESVRLLSFHRARPSLEAALQAHLSRAEVDA